MSNLNLEQYPFLAEFLGDEKKPDDSLMNLMAEDLKDASVGIMAIYTTSMGILDRDDRDTIAHAASIISLTYRNIMRLKAELFN